MKNKQNGIEYKKTRNYLRTIGYSIHTGNIIIKDYMGDLFTDYNNAGKFIQGNWNAFMIYYGSVKKNYKRDEPTTKRDKSIASRSYIAEALRYTNGSADDF